MTFRIGMYRTNIFIIFYFNLLCYTKCQYTLEVLSNITSTQRVSAAFSGLYLPDVTYNAETYSGSWLAPKERFTNAKESILSISNLEGASFCMINTGPMLMTRDFFDFEVLHLSSTTNNLPSISNERLFTELYNSMERNAFEYSQIAKKSSRRNRVDQFRQYNKTVALIPFSLTPGSYNVGDKLTPLKIFTNKVRLSFFLSTFWSVFRYFHHIVVVVASKADYNIIALQSLPVFELVDLSDDFLNNKYNRHLLPRETLKYGLNRILDSNDKKWNSFNYIYYSEADQILHLRHSIQIFNAMDKMKGTIALSPHRMQSIALPQAYPNISTVWNQKFREKLKHVNLVNEDLIPRGSCCDNGRFVFKQCNTMWWYNCDLWGLSNYSTWIKFGRSGWTLPLATEHQAKCTYFTNKVQCPVPINCNSRLPKPDQEFCKEIPNIEKTYGSG